MPRPYKCRLRRDEIYLVLFFIFRILAYCGLSHGLHLASDQISKRGKPKCLREGLHV